MIASVENPNFRPEDFDAARKKPGVSAILRLKNEEDYLEKALDSIRPFFDEFVIVYNQCSDRTPEIVEKFASEEPKRVRVFHYLPEVFPGGSEQHLALPADHVSSLVHYYNFALSKISYRICAKWDGDMIAAPEPFARVMNRLRRIKPGSLSWWLSPWRIGFWWYSGVNLWDQDGKTFVIKPKPRSGSKWDCGFWPAGRRNTFRHAPQFEVLNTRWLKKTFVGFLFFHVKAMKKDRGVSAYQLRANRDLRFRSLVEKTWIRPDHITFEEYCKIEPAARSMPNPESLGIRPVRN